MEYGFTFYFMGFKNFKKFMNSEEKLMGHYKWVIDSCNNINKNNKY